MVIRIRHESDDSIDLKYGGRSWLVLKYTRFLEIGTGFVSLGKVGNSNLFYGKKYYGLFSALWWVFSNGNTKLYLKICVSTIPWT